MKPMSAYRATARMVAAIVLALAATTGALRAQSLTEAQKSAMKANCRSDFIANCMSTTPGSKEALQCLQSKLDSLSPGCKSAVAATMAKPTPPPPAAAASPPPAPPKAASAPPPPTAAPSPAKAATAPPPRKAAAPPAAKRKAKAVAPKPARPATASAPLPTVIAPPPQPDPAILMAKAERMPLPKKLAIFRACNRDQATICPTTRPGGGRLIVCLAQHPDALSQYCRQTLMGMLQ